MPKSEGPSPGDPPPKLTLSQRLLAALPSLQKPTPTARETARGRSGSGGSNGSGEVVRPDEVVDSPKAKSGGRPPSSTARSTAAAAKSAVYEQMSLPDLQHAMKYLDDHERRIPLFVGPLLAALDLSLTIVALHSNPPVGHKNHSDPTSILLIGIGSAVVALLVVVSALRRRRSFTIFTLLFAGYGGGLVTILPAWLAAGWLFVRFNRMQRVYVSRTRGSSGARQTNARSRSTSSAGSARGRPARPKLGRKEKAPEPTGPPASKRYTPPKPTGG